MPLAAAGLLALASALGGCGVQAPRPTRDAALRLERDLLGFLPEVRASLAGVDAPRWIDTYLRKRLTVGNSRADDPDDAWLARVLEQVQRDGAEVAPMAAVAGSLTAADVVLVTDIHTCRLHQAAYWVLVQMLETYVEGTAVRVVPHVEALGEELLDAAGHVRAERPWLPDGFDVAISMRELGKRWHRGSEFLAWPRCRYREIVAEVRAEAQARGQDPDWRVAHERYIEEVNRHVVAAIRSRAGGAASPIVCLFVGAAHARALPVPLLGSLRKAGLRVTVIHPYVPELVAREVVWREVLRGAWVRTAQDEYLAPLPREVGVALGLLPEREDPAILDESVAPR